MERAACEAYDIDECEILIAFDLSRVTPEQVRKAEKALQELGVSFDTGTGCGERHWEWDYSLSGPVMVRYKRRGKRNVPEFSE